MKGRPDNLSERLIIAEEGSYVSYLEGCTAPAYDKNQLHAAVVELIALEGGDQVLNGAKLVFGKSQDRTRGHLQFCHKARALHWIPLENFLDAGRSWGCDHLEISQLIFQGDESVGEFYSVALTNG